MTTSFSHVLLIDDDPTANFIHEHFIKKLNVADRASKVSNGKEALLFIQTHWTVPSEGNKLIMVELHMPVMDGFEFLDHYTHMHLKEEIAIVVLTSSLNHQDLVKARQYPLLDYIEKPLTKVKIERLLWRWENPLHFS